MDHSQYQLDIFKEVQAKSGNVAINSVAGSGKTYTCVESLTVIPRFYSVQFCAFGRDIAAELRTRDLPDNCKIATYNAFGWGIVRNCAGGKVQLDKEKTKKILQYKVLNAKWEDQASMQKFYKFKYPIERLVSLLKGECVFTIEEALKRIPELLEHYAIDVPTDPDFITTLLETFNQSINHQYYYDFDDQVYQVLRNDWLVPAFDYVFVDEFQDTNEMQSRLMQKACHGGRFFGVGDPDQSIFGFRGATPDAFGKFIKDFKAKEMPLSICYRCPKLVVERAKLIVPRIEAAPNAIDGTVATISTPEFLRMAVPGDFILCRTVAPLVRRCLWFIRERKPAKILGRDLGSDIEYLVDKVCNKNYFIGIRQFNDMLNEYVLEKLGHYGPGNLALALEDKYQTILALAEDCDTVSGIMQKLDSIFSDDVIHCLKHMTIHKSKGLECENNVFLLRPDLLPHPRSKGKQWMEEEEKRLEYVAVTRTKNGLYFVTKESGEK